MFKKLFLLNLDDSRPCIKIVLWWEYRRILYNFFLIAFGIIALIMLSLIVEDLWSFFSPPIFFLFWTASFLFLANVAYTGGWIFQLATRGSKNSFVKGVKPKLFVYGILFSFFVQLTPSIAVGLYTLISGERIKSRYADFTNKKPNWNDVVGEYTLSEVSKAQLNYPDSLRRKVSFRLNLDSTFTLKYFPDHGIGMDLTDYEIVDVTGKWTIEESQGRWVVPMDFNLSENKITGQIDSSGFYYSNSFHINKNSPPYEIYVVVGDPDSWEGVTFQKKKAR